MQQFVLNAIRAKPSQQGGPPARLCAGCEAMAMRKRDETRDRTGDLQIFSLTLSQLSYRG